MTSVDLKCRALSLLKLSRKFLLEDGDLDPTAFIITADDQLLRPINLQNEARKVDSCLKICREARAKRALAIITIFLARSKSFIGEGFDEEHYAWGDIQDTGSNRCILVTASGPGIKNWATALPFSSIDGSIAFGKRVEFKNGVDLGLFPGWSDQITSSKGS